MNKNKTVTLVQSIVCLACVILMFVFCFTNVFTMKITDKTKDAAEEFYAKLDVDAQIPEEVEVSFGSTIKSFASLGKAGKAIINTVKGANQLSNAAENADTYEEQEQLAKDADKLMDDTKKALAESVDGICLILGIFGLFGSSAIVGLAGLVLLGMVLLHPIFVLVAMIKAIIAFTKNSQSLDKAYAPLAASVKSAAGFLTTYLFIAIMVPAIKFAFAFYAMMVAVFAVVIMNAVASRLKDYTAEEAKYLNLVQIVSAAGIVSFVIFLAGMIKANVMETSLNALKSIKVLDLLQKLIDKKVPWGVLIYFVLLYVGVLLLINTCGYLFNSAYRMSAMAQGKKVRLSLLSSTILATVSAVCFGIMFFAIKDVTIVLSDEQKTGYVMVVIGALLLLACEIVLLVMSGKSALTDEQKKGVLCGVLTEAPAAEEAAPVAEAPAEEAPAEEAPAEEAPAEEAPAEEAPAEEETNV